MFPIVKDFYGLKLLTAEYQGFFDNRTHESRLLWYAEVKRTCPLQNQNIS